MDLQKPREFRNRLLELLNDIDDWLASHEEKYFKLEVVDDSTVSLSWDYIGATDILFTNDSRGNKDWFRYTNLTSEPLNPNGTIISNLGKDKTFTFKLEGTDAEVTYSTKQETPEEPEQPKPEKPSRKVPVSFYYPQPEMREFVNCEKTWQVGQVNEVLKNNEYCVVSISGLLKDGNWEQKIKNIGKRIPDTDKLLYILIQDEPRHAGYSVDDLEEILGYCHQYWSAKPAINYTVGEMLDKSIPKTDHVVVCNFYPFFEETDAGYAQIFNEEDFADYLERVLDVGDYEFGITAQAFYSTPKARHPWRKPPVGSPHWYKRFIQSRDDIIHLQWWAYKYGRDDWKYAKDMPELLEEIKNINKQLWQG